MTGLDRTARKSGRSQFNWRK